MVPRQTLQRTRQVDAALAELLLGRELGRERPTRTLDTKRMRDELVEATADGQHAGAREAIEGAPARERAAVSFGDLPAQVGEIALCGFLFGVEVRDAAIER